MKKDSKKLEGVLLSSLVTLTSVSAATNISKAYSLSTNQTATATTNLNMRSTSSISGKILLTLKQGTKIEVIKKLDNGWYEVRYNNITGYVNGSYVTVENEMVEIDDESSINKIATTTVPLNMRNTSSIAGTILLTLRQGAEVEVIKNMNNGWYEVTYNGQTGYVNGSYITFKNTTTDNTVTQLNQIGTTTADLNMRDSYSTSGKILSVLKQGTKVELIKEMGNGWYQVKYNGQTGYVSSYYITISTSLNTKESNSTDDSDFTGDSNSTNEFNSIKNLVKEDQEESSITKLVNKENTMTVYYKPKDLVKPDVLMSKSIKIRKVAATPLENMFNAAKKDGVNLAVVSGYRSYTSQQSIYLNCLATRGKDYVDAFIARPGQSEHQTGLAVDISSKQLGYALVDNFGETAEGRWLAKNAHKYGFILRYKKDRVKDTGYSFEPWHYRYVGTEVATNIYENNLILEDLF